MTSIPTIAAIRFGYGLGRDRGPVSASGLLSGLADGNSIARKYPVRSTAKVLASNKKYRTEVKAAQKAGTARPDSTSASRRALTKAASFGLSHGTARILDTTAPFFERLNWFWADHFTAVGKNLPGRAAAPAYLDEAIRPNITGKFSEMLRAVVTHPFMLFYLDQVQSAGPNSPAGQRRDMGLNENLAREVLELHTLGVGGDYSQDDVRQFAELLTGLSFHPERGFVFAAQRSEPGSKMVIGKRYGGRKPDLDDIFEVLDDLAVHPVTARHLAQKLAVHFVSDKPDADLVQHMTAAYLSSGGQLMALYSAMLEHPGAWGPLGQKAKQPFDFITSALVALNLSGKEFLNLDRKKFRSLMVMPLAAMGQPFMQARGPDGWPEAAGEWITPQGLATRIAWAVGLAGFVDKRVGDPREFLKNTLSDAAGEKLTWAVGQTETAQDGIALVFASAEFNRR